jgi:hypothetical protein
MRLHRWKYGITAGKFAGNEWYVVLAVPSNVPTLTVSPSPISRLAQLSIRPLIFLGLILTKSYAQIWHQSDASFTKQAVSHRPPS